MRRFSFFALLLITLMPLLPSAARAQSVPGPIDFEVLRGDEPMGTHRFRFAAAESGLEARILIDLEVKVAFITAYRYTHRNSELWRDGQLIRLQSTTDDDGETFRVTATREGNTLRVNSLTRGAMTHTGVSHSTTYFDYGFVRQTQVLNSQSGELLNLSWTNLGVGSVPMPNGSVQAEHWRAAGDLPLDLWYEVDTKELVGLAFTARGERITYRRTNPLGS